MWAWNASMSLLVLVPTNSPRLPAWFAAHRLAVLVLVQITRSLVWGYTIRTSHTELLLNGSAGWESRSALRAAASKVGGWTARLTQARLGLSVPLQAPRNSARLRRCPAAFRWPWEQGRQLAPASLAG
jgi:hypothetical protein